MSLLFFKKNFFLLPFVLGVLINTSYVMGLYKNSFEEKKILYGYLEIIEIWQKRMYTKLAIT